MLIKRINENCYMKLVWTMGTDAYYNSAIFYFDWVLVCVDAQPNIKVESLGEVELYCSTGSSLTDTTGKGYSITVPPHVHFAENGFFVNTRDLGPGEYSAVTTDTRNLPNGSMYASTIQGQFLSPIEITWTGLEVYVDGQLMTDPTAEAMEKVTPGVGRKVSAVLNTAYAGRTANIKLERGATTTNLPVEILYTIGEHTGTIVNRSTATNAASWTVPTDLRQYAKYEDSAYEKILLTCITYDRFGTRIGEVTTQTTLIFDGEITPAKILSIEVEPTTNQFANLTGDLGVGIKYFSDFWVSCKFQPATGAAVVSKKVIMPSGKVYDFTNGTAVKIPNVEEQDFIIECEDSYGFVVRELHGFPMVYYEKIACSVSSSTISTDGKATVTVSGYFYNRSFGALNNHLDLILYVAPTSYGNAYSGESMRIYDIQYDGDHFTATVNLTGLKYESSYYCEAMATDVLMTYNSSVITIGGKPLFDWGQNDFQFNIPVNLNEGIKFAPDRAITGVDANGNTVEAMVPCDSAGNTRIGYTSYSSETGGTSIYGNDVNLFAANDINCNGYSLMGLINALTQSYSFTPTSTAGDNFSTASMALTLRGNCLYCRVYGSRSNLSGTGDFTDELLGRFSFRHEGKIKSMDYIDAVTGGSGPTAAISMKNVDVDSDSASFEVYLTSSASGARNFMANFVIPVTIDINNY